MARGIIEGLQSIDLRVPMVIRLSGTNADEGMALLQGHPKLQTAPTMQEAARKIVQLAGGAR